MTFWPWWIFLLKLIGNLSVLSRSYSVQSWIGRYIWHPSTSINPCMLPGKFPNIFFFLSFLPKIKRMFLKSKRLICSRSWSHSQRWSKSLNFRDKSLFFQRDYRYRCNFGHTILYFHIQQLRLLPIIDIHYFIYQKNKLAKFIHNIT